jgi:hypothetical protein
MYKGLYCRNQCIKLKAKVSTWCVNVYSASVHSKLSLFHLSKSKRTNRAIGLVHVLLGLTTTGVEVSKSLLGILKAPWESTKRIEARSKIRKMVRANFTVLENELSFEALKET